MAVRAERAMLKKAGRRVSGADSGLRHCKGDELRLTGLVASTNGLRIIKDVIQGKASDAETLGVTLAEKLLKAGAEEILDELYRVEGEIEAKRTGGFRFLPERFKRSATNLRALPYGQCCHCESFGKLDRLREAIP